MATLEYTDGLACYASAMGRAGYENSVTIWAWTRGVLLP